MSSRTALHGTRTQTSGSSEARSCGRTRSLSGGSGTCRRPTSGSSRAFGDWTPWSSVAGPGTCRRGARPIGVDNSGRQLATARRFQDEFGIGFPLIHADAERLPFRDASVDLAISEYGAAIWCDPYRWIPEAARVLRPGGRLVFLGHSYLAMLTFPDEDLPASEQLQRDHFGMHRFDWPEAGGAVEFALTHGDMIRLLRGSGFEVEDLLEIRAPEGAETPTDPLATADWARRWPIEEAWKARKTT
jgi:SAM-dependent methyltransferase